MNVIISNTGIRFYEPSNESPWTCYEYYFSKQGYKDLTDEQFSFFLPWLKKKCDLYCFDKGYYLKFKEKLFYNEKIYTSISDTEKEYEFSCVNKYQEPRKENPLSDW